MYSIVPIIELKSLLFLNICFVQVHTSCPKLNHVMVDFHQSVDFLSALYSVSQTELAMLTTSHCS